MTLTETETKNLAFVLEHVLQNNLDAIGLSENWNSTIKDLFDKLDGREYDSLTTARDLIRANRENNND